MKLLCIFAFSIFCTFGAWAQDAVPPVLADPNAPEDSPGVQIEYSSISSYLSPFIFRGDGRRDPFRAPEIALPLVRGELYGPFLPLQEFKIEQLKLKGLFWDIKTPKALISDPDGVTHRVGIKDYLGENFGYVASIREKELVIIQTLDENGQRYSTTKVMFFKQPRSTK